MVNDQTVPLVYYFLQNRSENNIRAFRPLKKFNPGLQFSQIVVDFEKAPITVFLEDISWSTFKRLLLFILLKPIGAKIRRLRLFSL